MILRVLLVAGFLGAAGSDAGAVKRPWYNRTPKVENSNFELSLRGIRRSAVRKARIHQAGDQSLIVFLPGAKSPRRFRKYTKGPIASLKTRKVKRGTVVVLETRGSFYDLKSRLEVIPGRRATLRFRGETLPTEVTSLLPSRPSQKKMVPEKLAVRRKPLAENVDLALPVSAVKGDEAGVVVSTSKAVTGFPWARKKGSESVSERSVARVGPRYSSVATSGMLGLMIFGGLAGLWAMRKKTGLHGEIDGIEVVAVQGLLGKHKLALVQTCGERLLIAASDKEVRLLSHVGSDLVNPASLGQMLPGQWEGPAPHKNEAPPPAQKQKESPARPAPLRGTVGGNVGYPGGTFSSDLDGLLKLRNQPVEKPAASSVVGHLSARYAKDGVAA